MDKEEHKIEWKVIADLTAALRKAQEDSEFLRCEINEFEEYTDRLRDEVRELQTENEQLRMHSIVKSTKPAHGYIGTVEQYALSLPAYQKIANAQHDFNMDKLYSHSDISRLTGLSSVGVRQRAIMDKWPTASLWNEPSKVRHPAFVSGEFLRLIQLRANRETSSKED